MKINVDTGNILSKDDSFFSTKRFDVVCCSLDYSDPDKNSRVTLKKLGGINALCRKNGVKFFLGTVFGFYGFMFEDLTDQHIYEQEEVPSAKAGAASGSVESGKPHQKPASSEESTASFVSLESVVNPGSWTSEESLKGKKFVKYSKRNERKFPKVFAAVEIVDAYLSNCDCIDAARQSKTCFNWQALNKLRLHFLASRKLDEQYCDMDFIKQFAGSFALPETTSCTATAKKLKPSTGEAHPTSTVTSISPRRRSPRRAPMSSSAATTTHEAATTALPESTQLLPTPVELNPVCAVVGGIYAQEVLKSLSHKGACHNNTFTYDGYTGTGLVVQL